MSRKGRYKGNANKYEAGAFLRLPLAVLNSPAYLAASPYARALLLDLAVQYRGNNNGDLSAAWSFMALRGWRSKETLTKAKRELMHLGLIVETRKGARPNKASLYALTWMDLDEDSKLEITARGYQRGLYKQYVPKPEGTGLKARRKSVKFGTPAVLEAPRKVQQAY